VTTPRDAASGPEHLVAFGHHRSLDGLRGIAVLAVVIYHFAPGAMPGGFLGVDVFFVLSGFLITSLLLVEFGLNQSVSLRGFWSRRARRLLPAALAVIGVSVALSWWLEPASTRASTRTQSLASLLYVNNWSAIASGNSYEAQFGRDTPLAHFWSLAVEEQFYILFPLVVMGVIALLRGRRRADSGALARPLLLVAGAGAIISAALMATLHVTDTDPSRVYFGSDTRAHALLVGVALACLNFLIRPTQSSQRDRVGPMVAIGSLGVLFGAFMLTEFHQNWLYEGGLLGIAILTAFIIWTAVRSPDHVLARALQHPWLVQLGLVSYGLYLWHWPVRAFLTTGQTGLDGFALFAARTLVTALATLVSLLVIERPFRHSTHRSSPRGSFTARQTAFTGAALVAVGFICLLLTNPVHLDGQSARSAPPTNTHKVTNTNTDTEPTKILLVGDSVAWTLGGGVLAFPEPDTYVSPFPPSEVALWNRARFGLSIQRWPKRRNGVISNDCATCEPTSDWRSEIIEFQPDFVVFSAVLWDTYDLRIDGEWVQFGSPEFDAAYLGQLEELRSQIISSGSRLAIMLQPRPGHYPNDWSDQYVADSKNFPHLIALQRQFAMSHPDVAIIDLDAELCPDGACRVDDDQGRVLRADGLHFTTEGATAMSAFLTRTLTSLRSDEPTPATAELSLSN
jgi:peptidoglycan/LPS O-acetylase OafA/YrhL